MAKASGLDQRFLVAGYNISGDTLSVESGSPRGAIMRTGISSSARERLLTHMDGRLMVSTALNDASDQQHTALSSLPTTNVHGLWVLTTPALSAPACALVAKQMNYDASRGQDGSLDFVAELLGEGTPLEFGSLLTAGIINHTGATSETGEVDAQSTAGLRAYLQVTGFTGTDATVTIEDSSDTTDGDDGSWGSLVAFSQVTGAQTTERVTVTGTVEKGLRVTTSTSGGFSSMDFIVMFQRGTAQDIEDLS